jgi:SAM-dependent methyltransferase
MESSDRCRICHSVTKLKWPSNLESPLSSESFAITDAHYGQTSTIYECSECGFRQCSELTEVLGFYEQLEDIAYEQGRKERAIQAKVLLKQLNKFRSDGRLVDVGAGSGILVEVALTMGYEAEGIEPSNWLQKQAANLNLPVRKGLLGDLDPKNRFDVITLIDVIEHVEDPIKLLTEIGDKLTPSGVAMVVTPDCDSFIAKLLGRKWWHYRVAHIGYLNEKTLRLACEKAGFEIVSMKRPGWYFTMDYLWVRLLTYFPRWMRISPMNWMKRITIPVNLRDSLSVILKHQNPAGHGNR